MPFEPRDILLALKHIALSPLLNGTEKQFAAFTVDSFNRKTGRCDPSIETAAHVLQLHKRTIIRAGNRLASQKLFVKRKHGGHNHCNHYEPNWRMFRELEEQYRDRRKQWGQRFYLTKKSPSECQPDHPSDDEPVTQTSPKKPFQSTYLVAAAESPTEQRAQIQVIGPCNIANGSIGVQSLRAPYRPSPSSLEAAEISAQRRWNNDLLRQYRSTPAYAVIVEALDVPLQEAATNAELKRRGAGVACIFREMVRRGIQWSER
jgi:hypothetical protein